MYPSEKEIAKALLRHIYDHGGAAYEVTAGSTYDPLAEHFGLSREERQRTRDEEFGDGKVQAAKNIKVQWARNTLKKRGYLASSRRAYWRLSDKAVRWVENLAT